MTYSNNKRPARKALSLITRCALVAMLPAGSAMAIEFNTGNPDLEARWDNTIRYNLGVRMEDQDQRIVNGGSGVLHESDLKFGNGDVITNRVDLLSELDVVYQKKHGFRVSAAAWYDNAYSDHTVKLSPGLPGSYTNNTYNATTQRFYNGPSGEFLDAFAFTNFDLGNVAVGARLGKHVVYWGEGLLFGSHAISYSQAPVDGRKAIAVPGIEIKEAFLPINQLSFNAQLTNNLSIGGQYFLDWQPTRAPSGGTYFGTQGFVGADKLLGALPVLNNLGPTEKSGAFGLRLGYKLSETANLNVFYRQFDDYNPTGLQMQAGGIGFAHVLDTQLVGVSVGASVGATSVGWELSRRTNAPLQSADGIAGGAVLSSARGTTWHMILNGVRALPNLPIYDTATAVAELAVSHLQEVTANAANFKGVGAGANPAIRLDCNSGAAVDIEHGCATQNYMGIAFKVTPQWLQVRPGLDISLPLSLSYGLYGNSANAGSSGNEGEYSYSVGVSGMYLSKHEFTLAYSDRYQKTNYNPVTGLATSGNGSLYPLNDRGYLSFTYKTSF